MSRTPLREGGDFSVPLRDRKMLLSIADRLEYLPLLLAGPILRRTESDAVTVWVALKAPREVTLKVYATDAHGSIIRTLRLEGTRSTVPLGKHLHIVAVTAKPIRERERGESEGDTEKASVLTSFLTPSSLEPGQIYAYDLSFGSAEQNLAQALTAELFPQVTVSYFDHQLPTFALPPDDLNDLRLAHGSCRKLHGGGVDALPILDDLIEHSAKDPKSRLHQLFFTGDQIYGDDVADPLLRVATKIGDTLLGWEENLPLCQTSTPASDTEWQSKGVDRRDKQDKGDKGDKEEKGLSTNPTSYEYKKASELKPGQRSHIARDYCSFTAMLLNSPEKAKSHLFSLGEYVASYLLVWSPILWPDRLPKGKAVYKESKQARQWDGEVRHLKECMSQLWKVRRTLANVPTYMIFDDHDVTDDWYLNRDWCLNVLSKPLGRRVVQNAMLAYAVFQGWGNTPDQFEDEQPGENLLKAAVSWSASAGTDESASEKIAKCVGIPQLEPTTGLPKLRLDEDVLILDQDYPDGTRSIEWHYTIRSHKHEVIVLDTRTWRGYPLGNGERESLSHAKLGNEEARSRTVFSHQGSGEIDFADTRSRIAPGSAMKAAIAPPMLLCPTAFQKQIQYPLELSDRLKQTGQLDIEVTFVVLPTNLVSLRIIDEVQRMELEQGHVYNSDVGDAWNLNEVALSRLLAELFQRRDVVVVLSGDIHYGATTRLSYWLNPHHKETKSPSKIPNPPAGQSPITAKSQIEIFQIPSNARVLAQLTASAFKNGELKTYVIHTKAKSLAPELPQNWAGWDKPPQLVEIQVTPEKVRMLDVDVPVTGPVLREIKGVCGNWNLAWEMAITDHNCLPDWQYYVEWIKREKAMLAPWSAQQAFSAMSKPKNTTGWLTAVGNLLSRLWRNQWLQEGEQIIGRNNFGVVSLKWPQNNEETKAVIQDAYWQPPWEPSSIVYSRYFVPLRVDNPPPPPRIAPRIVPHS